MREAVEKEIDGSVRYINEREIREAEELNEG